MLRVCFPERTPRAEGLIYSEALIFFKLRLASTDVAKLFCSKKKSSNVKQPRTAEMSRNISQPMALANQRHSNLGRFSRLLARAHLGSQNLPAGLRSTFAKLPYQNGHGHTY